MSFSARDRQPSVVLQGIQNNMPESFDERRPSAISVVSVVGYNTPSWPPPEELLPPIGGPPQPRRKSSWISISSSRKSSAGGLFGKKGHHAQVAESKPPPVPAVAIPPSSTPAKNLFAANYSLSPTTPSPGAGEMDEDSVPTPTSQAPLFSPNYSTSPATPTRRASESPLTKRGPGDAPSHGNDKPGTVMEEEEEVARALAALPDTVRRRRGTTPAGFAPADEVGEGEDGHHYDDGVVRTRSKSNILKDLLKLLLPPKIYPWSSIEVLFSLLGCGLPFTLFLRPLEYPDVLLHAVRSSLIASSYVTPKVLLAHHHTRGLSFFDYALCRRTVRRPKHSECYFQVLDSFTVTITGVQEALQ
ncbi:hypothetical protein DL93DRAFT_2093857 [Clavulina sp. PMI_390]|nr:hypothetical protein DL93DRAFT_2093857 [Clavulina sp. PMI_390]